MSDERRYAIKVGRVYVREAGGIGKPIDGKPGGGLLHDADWMNADSTIIAMQKRLNAAVQIGMGVHAEDVYRTTGKVDTVRVENGADVGVIEVGDDGGDWVRLTVSRADALRLASHWSEELEVIVRRKDGAR